MLLCLALKPEGELKVAYFNISLSCCISSIFSKPNTSLICWMMMCPYLSSQVKVGVVSEVDGGSFG